MEHISSNEVSQSMQCALKEVVDVTREIADMSLSIVTKLQRPLVDTRDHIQCLVKETWTLLTTINQKVRMGQEILKKKLPHNLSLSDTQEQEQQVETFTVTENPQSILTESMTVLAPFSVKLPSTPPVNTSMYPKTRDLSKQVLQKTPSQRKSLPPRVPKNGGKVLVRNVRKAIGEENTSLNDVMGKEDITSDDEKYTSAHAMQSQIKIMRSGIVDIHQLEYLVTWMAEQPSGDFAATTKRLLEWLAEEFIAGVTRGMQYIDTASGDFDVQLLDLGQFLSEINEEVKKVKQSENLPVRGNGPDTILCLDTSASMYGDNFSEMIIAANHIIDGVEELAKNEAVQGNVAVATFGAQPIVANHLTNDYSKVRNVLDFLVAEGPSTLYRGLLMSIVACIGNYAEVSVNDVPLMARVIVLTDGKFSAQDAKDEHYRFYPQNDIMVPSAANLMKLKGIVCDCVQIGASSESILLQSLTKTTNGKVFPDDHVDELVNMPSYLFAATKLLRQFQDLVEGDKDARQNEEATLHALLDSESSSREAIEREFSESEKENIIAIAMNFLKLPVRKVAEQQEYLVKELELELPPVGTRVRRGPDWDPKDNIDSNGPGTVVCHNNNGTVSVLWDCGIGPLPYHCYDPCQVLSTDNDERAVRDDGWIQVGCKVVRGPDWTHGDDDGGQGSCGVVCLCTRKGTVTVRWPSRKIGEYRYGDEVVLLDTSEEHAQAAGYDRSISTREFEPGNKHNPKEYRKIRMPVSDNSNLKLLKQSIFGGLIKKDRAADVQLKPESDSSTPDVQAKPETESYIPFLWSYQQEGQVEWTSFDASNNGKLESDWSKQRKTTMVSANNKRYRVAFEKMTMSFIGGNNEDKQLRIDVKRERRNTQGVEQTED